VSSLSESVVVGYVRTLKKSGCTPRHRSGQQYFRNSCCCLYTASLTLVVVQHSTSRLPGWHAWLIFCTHCEHSCRWHWHV